MFKIIQFLIFSLLCFNLKSQIKFDSSYYHFLKNYQMEKIYVEEYKSDSLLNLFFYFDLDSNYFYDTTLSDKSILVRTDKQIIFKTESFEDNPITVCIKNIIYKRFQTIGYSFYKNKHPCSVYVFNDTNKFMVKHVSFDYKGNITFTKYYYKLKIPEKCYDLNNKKYIWLIDKRGINW